MSFLCGNVKCHHHFWYFASRHMTVPYLHLNFKVHHISNRYFKSTPLPHHYATLNIDSSTSVDDIKKSYNNLIKKWHPDRHSSKPPTQQKEAQKQFLLIREAYETIINHQQNTTNKSETNEKLDLNVHKAHGQRYGTGFTSGRRTPKASYYHYTWTRKVYERNGTETSANDTQNMDDHERYTEYYKPTWIGKTFEELYDWIRFLYLRHPSWMQFFLLVTVSFGITQCIWHFVNPNIDDSDPDRIWNSWNNKYQPSTSAAMSTTPNLVALQPHFKGHKLYEHVNENSTKFKHNEKYINFEEDSAFAKFSRVNKNSTVNRNPIKKKKKNKKRLTGDIEVMVIDQKGRKSKKIIHKNDLGPKTQHIEPDILKR